MTETSEAPMAYRMSTPNRKARSGTMTTPPPNPVREPRNPAAREPSQTRSENSREFMNHLQVRHPQYLETFAHRSDSLKVRFFCNI